MREKVMFYTLAVLSMLFGLLALGFIGAADNGGSLGKCFCGAVTTGLLSIVLFRVMYKHTDWKNW